jgi:hypothetical protein
MNKYFHLVAAACLVLALGSAHAQLSPPGGNPLGGLDKGPSFDATTAKLFGSHQAFSAQLQFETAGTDPAHPIVATGDLAFLEGKSRFQMDVTKIKGVDLPADALSMMKSLGMAEMTMISRPDKKVVHIVYPGLQAFTDHPVRAAATPDAQAKFKVETTELGRETVEGHPCVKNKVVVTDDQGEKHESNVWNATDVSQFPIRIESTQAGQTVKMTFKAVKLETPDAKLFEPPPKFTRHENIQGMMQAAILKQMGGADALSK